MEAQRTRGRAAAALGLVVVAVGLALILLDDGGEKRVGAPPAPPGAARPIEPGAGNVAGYVRDANGNPVAGARVSVAGGDASTESGRDGRYQLSAAGSRGTLTVVAPGHAEQQAGLAGLPAAGARIDFSLARTRAADSAPNSADRPILWAGCDRIAALDADAVERWIDRGIDGFVCSAGRLKSMGGSVEFNGVPNAQLDGEGFALQRTLRDSAVVREARRGRLKLYLGVYVSDASNEQTPFKEWFDDQAWANEVIPQMREVASAARTLGFAGVALDQELYPTGGGEPSWTWDYPGHTRTEPEARERVTTRGRELMRAFVEGYPGLELIGYATQLRDSWEEKVQAEVNQKPDSFDSDVRLDLWNGITSVEGWSGIYWLDAIFYKTPHLGRRWDPGLQYNAASVYAMLSRRLSNWPYASERLHLTPFGWIDKGPSSDFERPRSSSYVDRQLSAFRRWGTGGAFGIFAFGEFQKFDYGPYENAIRRASTPAAVDRRPPTLTVASGGGGGAASGTADDDSAIRVVRWYDDRGRFGTAKLTWRESGNPNKGFDARVEWTIDSLPPGARGVTIVAEDVKGLASVRRL
jgi:hypothetical protein